MSVFNKDQIQTPPTPQKYFELLCEEEFGFNLTTGSIYNPRFNSTALARIMRKLRAAYRNRFLMCYKVGFGQMEIRSGDMFDLPDDYWNNPDYDWIF